MYVKDGTSRLKKVLVSRPQFLKPAPINEIAKKWKDTVMDVPTMLREHELFVGAYKKAGVEVEFLEPDEERPNSVFARDFGGCVKEGYIPPMDFDITNISGTIPARSNEKKVPVLAQPT